MGKHLQTAAALACTKTLLMVFNFAFWVSRNCCNENDKIYKCSSPNKILIFTTLPYGTEYFLLTK